MDLGLDMNIVFVKLHASVVLGSSFVLIMHSVFLPWQDIDFLNRAFLQVILSSVESVIIRSSVKVQY